MPPADAHAPAPGKSRPLAPGLELEQGGLVLSPLHKAVVGQAIQVAAPALFLAPALCQGEKLDDVGGEAVHIEGEGEAHSVALGHARQGGCKVGPTGEGADRHPVPPQHPPEEPGEQAGGTPFFLRAGGEEEKVQWTRSQNCSTAGAKKTSSWS